MITSETVKEVSPWFFNLRQLVSNRPNLVPHGLGNNEYMIDTSILLASTSEFESDVGLDSGWLVDEGETDPTATVSQCQTGSPTPVTDNDDSDDSDESIPPKKSQKCKQVNDGDVEKGKAVEKSKKMGTRAGTSTAAQPAAKKAKTGVMDKFNAVSIAEEETIQRQLELKKIKASGVRDVKVERVKAQAQVKIETARMKHDTMRERARQEHEFWMAQMQMGQGGRHNSGPLFGSPANTSFFSPVSSQHTYDGDAHSSMGSATPSDVVGLQYNDVEDLAGPFTAQLNDPGLSQFYTTPK
jgi:hypothetical protein